MNQLYPIIRRIRRPLLPPEDPVIEVRHLTPALSPIEAERVGGSAVAKQELPAGSPESPVETGPEENY